MRKWKLSQNFFPGAKDSLPVLTWVTLRPCWPLICSAVTSSPRVDTRTQRGGHAQADESIPHNSWLLQSPLPFLAFTICVGRRVFSVYTLYSAFMSRSDGLVKYMLEVEMWLQNGRGLVDECNGGVWCCVVWKNRLWIMFLFKFRKGRSQCSWMQIANSSQCFTLMVLPSSLEQAHLF